MGVHFAVLGDTSYIIIYVYVCILITANFVKKSITRTVYAPFFYQNGSLMVQMSFTLFSFVVFFGVKAANTGIIKAGSGDGFRRRNGLRECCSLTASIGGTCLALTVVLYGFSVFCPLFSRVCSRRFRGVSRSVASPYPLLRRPRDRCFFQRTFRGSFGPRSTPSLGRHLHVR